MQLVTVFTPTYNRANLLPNLYNSLVNQTCKDFIWYVVDDGSTDNTKELINKWNSDNLIKIKYTYCSNAGKMRAHNLAVKNTKTQYFFCVDSDDYLDKNAIQTIKRIDYLLPKEINIAGILAYRKVNDQIHPELDIDSQYITVSHLYNAGYKGETALVFRTEVIEKFPFPVVDNEKFITESIAYDLIDLEYLYYFLQEDLIIGKYYPDGYSSNWNSIYLNNPRGWTKFYIQKYTLTKNKKYLELAYCFTYISRDRLDLLSIKSNYHIGIVIKIRAFFRYLKMRHPL